MPNLRHSTTLAGLTWCFLAGCSDPCPGAVLDLRSFERGPVTETAYTCSGSEALATYSCSGPPEARAVRPSRPDDCHVFSIELGPITLAGVVLQIRLAGEATVTAAEAVVVAYCDEQCALETGTPLRGTLAVESYSAGGGRNSGAFRVEFADGIIEGTYLTGGPP